MANEQVLYGLIRKRAEVAGKIAEIERDLAQHRTALSHLDATLRLFKPDLVPALIAPRASPRVSQFFTLGELSGLILTTLRDAGGPITASAIALRVVTAKGLDAADKKLRAHILKRVRCALGSHRRSGTLETVGEGWDTQWIVAEPGLQQP